MILKPKGQGPGGITFEAVCEKCGESTEIMIRPQAINFGVFVKGKKGPVGKIKIGHEATFNPRTVI